MSEQIEWAEPPQKPQGKWVAVADQLRANPGKWARIRKATSDGNFASKVKRGSVIGFDPAGMFEARCVEVDAESEPPRRYDIYARFVGNGGAR